MLANRNAASTIQRACIGRWFLQRATPGWRADAAVSAVLTAASARRSSRSSACSHRSGGSPARPAPAPHSALGRSFVQAIAHGLAVPLVKVLHAVFHRALVRAGLIVAARQQGPATGVHAFAD